jgi:hypothetical protein
VTVPWAGATLEIDSERWLPSVPVDGPFPQFVALNRVTSARIPAALAVVKSELVFPLGRVTRGSVAQVLTVDAQPPLDYYPAEVLSDVPEVYWRLDSGPDAIDYSGNNRTGYFEAWEGYYQTGQLQLVDGILGQGQRFDDHQVLYEDPDTYTSTVDFTIELWYQTDRANPIGTSRLVDVAGGQKAIGMQTTNDVGYLWGRWGQSNTSTRTNLVPWTMINDGEWHHLVLTRESSSVRFYVDGQQEYALDSVPAYTPSSYSGIWLGSFSPEFPTDPPTPAYDEVAYYSRALSPVEVKRHYDSAITLGEPPLDATYPLGRVTSARLAQPLGRQFAQALEIGQVSRSSSARQLTVDQGAAPGTPQYVSLGRASAARATRALGLQVVFHQQIALGRVSRASTARALTYSTGLVYQDDFNRPDGALGSPVLGGPYSYPYGTGGVSIAAGALRSTTTGSMQITVPAVANFDAEVEIRNVGANGAFMFRYQTTSIFWMVRWTPEAFSLIRKSGAGEAAYGTMAPLSAGAVVRVVGWGKILLVYLNGRLVFAAEDHQAPAGTVGFYWLNDTTTRIERAQVKQAIAPADFTGEVDEAELGLLLAVGTEEALLFKGRDARLADEGAMA